MSTHAKLNAEEREELEDLRFIFELQKGREQIYIERWQKAVNRPDVLPDYGKFMEYLMDAVEMLKGELNTRVDYAIKVRQQHLRIHELELEKIALIRSKAI